MNLTYKNEQTLFGISIAIGVIFWLALVVGTLGIALIYVLLFFLIYLFAHSGFISHLRGNAIELSAEQFPDLYRQYIEACERLEMEQIPKAYLMMSDGVLNALATKFLRRYYVVLYSSIVEALRSRPEALRFYFGHELAHVKRGHLNLNWLKFPASILPLLGPAYRRAQEYTCDLHGLAASNSTDDALAALAVLGTGGDRLEQLSVPRFVDQQRQSGGFWMSYHELTNDYPWLCKRLANVARAGGSQADLTPPSRNFLAGFLALFTPRIGMAGGAGSMIVMVAIIGILAAIALPAYQDYTLRAQVVDAMAVAQQVQAAATDYVTEHKAYPQTHEEIGLPETFDEGVVERIELVEDGFALVLRSSNAQLDQRTIIVGAHSNDDGTIGWHCTGGTVELKHRPQRCRQ